MDSRSFPPSFPPELVTAAFKSGDEAAWPLAIATSAVEWFGRNGYAVLGTELWLLQGTKIQSLPIGSSGMREVHGNTVDRQRGEPWSVFANRAMAETCAYLRSFNASEIIESGELYFNLTWVDQNEFETLGNSI